MIHSSATSQHEFKTAIAGLLCLAMLCGVARAEVELQTVEGRTIKGVVDSRSDSEQLWLRTEQEGIILGTAVSWEAIEHAALDGNSVVVDQLRQRTQELASSAPEGYLMEYGPPPQTIEKTHAPFKAGRISSLEIQARLVNLDRTVELDGIEVAVAAVDEFGEPVPVRGNLYVRLQVERNLHHSGRIRFQDIQQWNQPVSPLDFEDGVALYALKFRAFAPEFDDQLRPDAQVNARLGVFGQGNFSSTVPIPLWEFNPLRDRLQMFEGSRFFRDEVTHRPRHLSTDPPGIYRKVWRRWE